MKSFSSPVLSRIIPVAVLVVSSLWPQPTFAQDMAVNESPVAEATTVETPAIGTTTTAAVTPATQAGDSDVLSVALPPQTKLRMDVDAREKELLGIVKSLLSGFKGESVKEVLGARAADGGTAVGTRDLPTEAALRVLSEVDLSTALQNISHLRVVAFEVPTSQWLGDTTKRLASTKSILSFYEGKYLIDEKGSRMLKADFDDVQWLGVSFPDGGLGIVFAAPGVGIVVRANGYPDLQSVGPILTAMGLSFSSRATVR